MTFYSSRRLSEVLRLQDSLSQLFAVQYERSTFGRISGYFCRPRVFSGVAFFAQFGRIAALRYLRFFVEWSDDENCSAEKFRISKIPTIENSDYVC
jgi:hypothetical protein